METMLTSEDMAEHLQHLYETDQKLHQKLLNAVKKFYKAFKESYEAYSDSFTVFDRKLIGTARAGDTGFFGKGFYFAFSEGEAEMYGKNVMKAYLRMSNACVVTIINALGFLSSAFLYASKKKKQAVRNLLLFTNLLLLLFLHHTVFCCILMLLLKNKTIKTKNKKALKTTQNSGF